MLALANYSQALTIDLNSGYDYGVDGHVNDCQVDALLLLMCTSVSIWPCWDSLLLEDHRETT